MAVEQKVVIRVEIDPDMTKAAAVNAFLSTLDKRLDKTNKKLNKTRDLLKEGVAFHLGRAARKMADFGKAILKVNFKGLIVELGLVTIGLVAMKGALSAGRGIMRGWNSTVSFLKVTTAGFTASIVALVSALMAANRQFQQTQLSPFIGGMQNAREAMGALRSESLAPMGVQNVAATAAMLSKAGLDTRKQAAVMREMANISSADPKSFQAMSQAIAQVQSSGSTKAGVEALRGLGPMFKDVAGKAGSMSADEFIKAMGSGKLTPEAFQGQMDKINQTLMGGFKGMVTKFYVALSDMGLVFLDPLRNALAQVEHIFLRTIYRVTGMIHQFGLETFIPKLVSGMERFTNWWVKLIANDLPRLLEVYGKIADWWRDFTAGTSRWFGNLGAAMDKFKESGTAAWEFWKNIFGEIGKFMGGRFSEYDKDIKKNRKEFEMFGTSLGRVIAGILGVVTAFKDEFMSMLPELNDFFSFLTLDVFPVMQDFAENFAKAFKSALPVIRNIVSAFLPLLTLLNSLIGGLSEAGMGLGVLFAGWLTMTQGGRGMMSATRGGFMGRAAPVGGQGAISHRFGQWAGGGQQAAAARGAGGGMGGFFAGRGGGNGFNAARMANRGGMPVGAHTPVTMGPNGKMIPVIPTIQGLKGQSAFATQWARTAAGDPNRTMSRMGGKMGMGTMIGGMLLSQLVGGMVGGNTGQTIANTGSMMAMGSMLGVPGMLAAGGLTLGKTAWDAETTMGGALSGIGAGAMTGAAIGSVIPGAGTVAGLVIGAITTAIFAGVGAWRGHLKAGQLADSGRALAEEVVLGLFDAIDTSTASDLRKGTIVEGYDQLLADDTVLTDMAKQKGVSKSALVAELLGRKNDLADHAADTLILIGESVETLGGITGETASMIEENAERWAIALQKGGQAIDDYIYKRNEGFRHTTAAEIEGLMLGATYDTLFDSPMHLEHRGNLAGLEAKAATNAFYTDMQDTGDVDMDYLDAYLRTGIAEFAASGMSVPQQNAAIGQVLANMGTNATKMGYGGGVQDAIRQVQANYGVTPGGTGKGFVDKTWEEFKKTNYYAQNLTERGGSLGMNAEEIEAGQRKLYGASDGAEQMQIFNQMIWSADADALILHKNEVEMDTEALKAFREALVAGTPKDPDDWMMTPTGLRRLDNSRPGHGEHTTERHSGVSEEIIEYMEATDQL